MLIKSEGGDHLLKMVLKSACFHANLLATFCTQAELPIKHKDWSQCILKQVGKAK